MVRTLHRYRFLHSIFEDLEDGYSVRYQNSGRLSADVWSWKETFGAFFKEHLFNFRWSFIMIKNYLTVALRNIRKHKGYSLINISGLAIGITVCLFILFWVKDELSYDRFNTNLEQIYRVNEDQVHSDGSIFKVAVTPEPLGAALKDKYPEVIEFARLRPLSRNLVKANDRSYYEEGIAFADPAMLKMFSFPLVSGDGETVLANEGNVVITESLAQKYFGGEDPIGKTIQVAAALDFIVSGVMEDIPANSHIQFQILGNINLVINRLGYGTSWWDNNFYTYIQMSPNADVERMREEIAPFMKSISSTATTVIRLQALKDVHLRSNYAIDLYGATQDKSQYVYIFTAVAVIILLLACINFMNLATARAGLRSKEVGLRKVVGAKRTEIIRQFFGEAILFATIACLISAGAVSLLLPAFNGLTGKTIEPGFLLNPAVLLFLAGIALFTGILSGIYPALFLSAFQPVSIFRGDSAGGSRSTLFRKSLVVLQFTLSMVFIAGTFIVGSQLRFIRSQNLGFDQEAVIHFRMRGQLNGSYPAFKNELLQTAGIKHVSAASDLPTYTVHSTTGFSWEGKNPEDKMLVHQYAVDPDYLATLGMELSDGRPFDSDLKKVNSAYIVNETAARMMGYNEPVGKVISLWNFKAPIIGVVKDFHFKSLHTKIEPLVLRVDPQRFAYIFVKMDTANIQAHLTAVEKMHNKHNPLHPFEFSFLDDSLDGLYRTDRRIGVLFNIFTALAIFISCLGLLGLASFLIERRTKEIGIRKIL
ncbi:MAG: ABC transporter permease, partial [Candidatus Aminicenantes bacterium]|nr:ABC transporter permease [Candidatus Aminicenantes bacterium]